MLEAIRKAAEARTKAPPETTELADLRARFNGLSERQRQVLELAAVGLSNKENCRTAWHHFRTVEIHRSWMTERMGARNLAELVRMDMRIKGDHA